MWDDHFSSSLCDTKYQPVWRGSVLHTACVTVAILWCLEDEALENYAVVNEIFFLFHLIYFLFHSDWIEIQAKAAVESKTVSRQIDWNYLVGVFSQELIDTLQPIKTEVSPRLWHKYVYSNDYTGNWIECSKVLGIIYISCNGTAACNYGN